MNDMYKKDFDLAGFCVGVVDKPRLLMDPQLLKDNIFMLCHTGIHSNGFSLAESNEWNRYVKEISIESLLTPTRIYANND